MPWVNAVPYVFGFFSVMENAPAQSGIYTIYNEESYIYIGEADDIRAKLINHLSGDYPCIMSRHPRSFSYELCSSGQRFRRQAELIRELTPQCNIRLYLRSTAPLALG
jgi:excinuclease UvrABC nuclease subunit